MTPPLTPADCDLRGMPYMPLHIQRLFDSEFYAVATGDEFKAGVSLWAKAFHQVPAGSLPNNERHLASLAGAGSAWKKVREMALHGWVLCSDGRLYHPVVAEVCNEVWGKRQAHKAKMAVAREALSQKKAKPNGSGNDGGNDRPIIAPNGIINDRSIIEPLSDLKCKYKGIEGKGKGKEGIPPNPLKGDDGDFERFWAVYPRKVGKGHARKAFAKAIPSTTIEAILAAIERAEWSPDPRYQPHPATWLNGQRWLDQTDTFDPVLRAVGLEPEDFDDPQMPMGLLQ